MRITGGAWRGRRVPELKGFKGRPTTDFGREGFFNLMSSRVDFDGAHVLDLFAGTGMVSLEFEPRARLCDRRGTNAQGVPLRHLPSVEVGQRRLARGVCRRVGFLSKPLTQFDLCLQTRPTTCPS